MSISVPQIGAGRESLGGEGLAALAQGRSAWLRLAHALLFWCFRLAFGAFLLLTSVYCLLVWVPFSYFGFIHNPLLSWLPQFVRLHGLIYGVLLAAVALTLIPDLRRRETRRAAWSFLAFNGCTFVYLWRANALAGLEPDIKSYLWSMLSLFPLAWLGALDFSSGSSVSREQEDGCSVDLARTTLAAVIVSVAFAATSALRTAFQGSNVSGRIALGEFAASLTFHLVIFTAVGFVLGFMKWATSITPWPRTLDYWLTRVFAWYLMVELLRRMILPTISFEGLQAAIFAAVVSFVLVFSVSGCVARLRAENAYRCLPTPEVRPAWLWGLGIIGLLAAAYGIPIFLGRTDWDFVLQRVAVILLWLAVLQLLCRTGVRLRGKALTIAVAVVIVGAVIGFARFAKLTLYNPEPSPKWQGALDAYVGADISFKTAYDILSRPVDNKAYQQFYEFLKQNTNLGRNVLAAPADTHLVSDLRKTPDPKPNIFLFVIDSLRRDYISPYTPAVDYTPAIDRFARQSVVLENAYTRYGGTALSEPAIWVGAMQLHKQYIEPYYPMNNLQKLLDVDGYHSYISVDPILGIMLHPSASITELDKGSNWADLDFIPTLKELEAKIDSRPDRAKPIFAYTQPQNVHTLNLERSKIKGGRKAVSIYELRRIDAAFGEFVEFLQQRGLYDNSIVILTADHGDSYGEFGRWGHSDFLFPEIIRIPLIVHLPQRMREQFVWDANALAFTTDITPSLYYLLGHRPILNNELFGRPLFTQTLEEQSAYKRSHYLIVSSYAPVYAILAGNGRSLFIADAVNSKSYYYDLIDDPAGTRNHVTIQLQNENEAMIRHELELIDNFYGWHSAR